MQIYAYMKMFLCPMNRIGHSHMGRNLLSETAHAHRIRSLNNQEMISIMTEICS